MGSRKQKMIGGLREEDYDFHFKKMDFAGKRNNRYDHMRCMICLCDFEMNEPVRKIGICKHLYHEDCLNLWMTKERSCPFCKANLNVENLKNQKEYIWSDEEEELMSVNHQNFDYPSEIKNSQ